MRNRSPVLVLIAAILAAAAAASVTAAGAATADTNDCKISLSVGLNNTTPGDVKTKYLFGVAANSAESCADVAYILSVTEQLPDASVKTTPIGGEMRVRGQTKIEAVPFETDSKNTVTKFTVKMNSCKLCNAP
jgi:hypothetical protein